jgi:hypothetical protein
MRLKRFTGNFLLFSSLFLFCLIYTFWVFVFGSHSAADPASPIHNLYNHNVWNYFLPLYKYTFERLRMGELPLWNPYQACGVPVLATLQSATFYPPNWLYCFVDTATGLKWLSVLHFFWAGLWIALFYKELFPDSDQLGALLCATGFVFSAYCVYQVWFPGNLYSASWLPCLLFMGERLVKRRNWNWTVLLAITVTLAFLAGFTQFTVYIYMLLTAYMVFRMIREYALSRRWNELRAALCFSAAAAGIALLLISPQLLPTFELIHASERRPGALSALASQVWAPDVYSFNRLIAGLYFRTVDSVNIIIVLGLFLAWTSFKDLRSILFLSASGFLALLLSLGTNTPFYTFYFNHVPTGNWFTTPARWRLILYFCVCVAGARGIDLLAEKPDQLLRPKENTENFKRIAFGAGFFLLTLGYIYTGGLKEYFMNGRLKLQPFPIFYGFQLLGLILCLFLVQKKVLSTRIVKLLIILLIFSEAISVSRMLHITIFPSKKYSTYHKAAGQFLHTHTGDQRAHLENNNLEARALPEKAASIFHFNGTTDWEPMTFYRYHDLLMAAQGNRLAYCENYGHFSLNNNRTLFSLFNLLSPKYIVFSDGAKDILREKENRDSAFIWTDVFPEADFPLVAQFDDIKIYENPSALPRVVFSPDCLISLDDRATLQLMTGADFDPLNKPVVSSPVSLRPANGKKALKNNVQIVEIKGEYMKLNVSAAASGILWTTDMHYPGWKVRVNGTESPLLRVNYAFRGVVLPPGDHTVEFFYESVPLKYGFALFSVGVLIIFAGFLVIALKKRRGERSLPISPNRKDPDARLTCHVDRSQ